MNFWDQQYAGDDYRYGTAPNAFLREQATRFASASDTLVPGDGEGRNGVWLATQGHRVTALDMSPVGLAKAQALAARQGVTITTLEANLAALTPAPASCDVLALIYLHLPPALRADVHARLATALRPGGWLLLEGFHPRQRSEGCTSGGPGDIEMLFTLDQLRTDWAASGLHEELAWEGQVTLAEGPGHAGSAWVTRYLAQRA